MQRVRWIPLLLAAVIGLAPSTASAQALPSPHVFFGSADLDGSPAPEGALVDAYIRGVAVAASTVSGASYVLRVQEPSPGSYASAAITSRVGGAFALQTAVFSPFSSAGLDLTATAPSATAPPVPSVPVASGLASIASVLEEAWHFDSGQQRWRPCDRRVPNLSDFTHLERGKGYLIRVTADATLVTSAFTGQLARGRNRIGWQGTSDG